MEPSMKRGFGLWCAVVLLAAGVIVRAAGVTRILPIVRDDQVVVSCELADAYTDEVRDAISSGLRTTFTYDLELRMVVPAWVDRTISTSVVSASDQYDNLTRRHTLTRTVNGRVEETTVTDDESVARQWLTTLTRVPLSRTSKLSANRDYYVRVSARARPHASTVFSFADAITGSAKFTFIP
jgi:hypothetical protein